MSSNRPYRSILRSLADREMLIPYLNNAILSQDWPDTYQITVDSSPYYGLGDGYFHPSSHGMMGARQLYYMFHPDHRDRMVPEQRDVMDEMTLAMGSALHAVVQTQFIQTGILRPENVEVEYILSEHNVRGRTDMVIDHPAEGPVVTEFKTCNSFKFNNIKAILPEWDIQLSMALHGLGHPSGILLMMEAGRPYRMREFRVPRNDQVLSEVFAKFAYVRECIAFNTPPEHCCALNSKEMDKCPARYECWLKKRVVRD